MSEAKTRNSNIELLRIIAMCGVIALHYNYGRAFNYVDIRSVNGVFLLFNESVFACCVNVFFIISGYFSWKRTSFEVIKAFDLIIEVLIIRIPFRVIIAAYYGILTKKYFALSLIPLNYYAILFISVMLVSPFVNIAVQKLEISKFRNLLIISLILFAVIPYAIDCIKLTTSLDFGDVSTLARDGSSYGYSFINFLLMYLIGAYIGKSNHCRFKKSYVIVLIMLWIALVILGYIAITKDIYINLAYSYCSPLVIATAILSFLAFKDLRINPSKFINKLASGSFTVYLTHGYILDYLHIEKFANANIFILFGHLMFSIVVLWIIGFCISLPMNLVIGLLNKCLKNKLPVIRSVNEETNS